MRNQWKGIKSKFIIKFNIQYMNEKYDIAGGKRLKE